MHRKSIEHFQNEQGHLPAADALLAVPSWEQLHACEDRQGKLHLKILHSCWLLSPYTSSLVYHPYTALRKQKQSELPCHAMPCQEADWCSHAKVLAYSACQECVLLLQGCSIAAGAHQLSMCKPTYHTMVQGSYTARLALRPCEAQQACPCSSLCERRLGRCAQGQAGDAQEPGQEHPQSMQAAEAVSVSLGRLRLSPCTV